MKEQREEKRQCEALWSIDLVTHTRTWKEEPPQRLVTSFCVAELNSG